MASRRPGTGSPPINCATGSPPIGRARGRDGGPFSRLNGPPLAHLPEWDQKAVTDHPWWETVRLFPTYTFGVRWGGAPEPHLFPMIAEMLELAEARDVLVDAYGWGIPSPADLAWITATMAARGHTRVVEVCAGTGYWAWQLAQLGLTVDATDIDPPAATWAPVRPLDAAVAAATAGTAPLLMVWPPHGTPAAHDALTAYTGDLLYFCGHGEYTGDDAFHKTLDAGWGAVDGSRGHVAYSGLGDRLVLFERRSV